METLPLTIYDPFDLAQDMFTIDYLILSLRSPCSLLFMGMIIHSTQYSLRNTHKERRLMEIFLKLT